MDRRHDLHVLGALGAALALVVAASEVAGLADGLLHLAPFLVLLLPLLGGRYLGEERLHALAAAAHPRPRRAVAVLVPRLPRAPRATAVRGGALLAARLGRRGPPVRAACAAST